MTRISNTYLSPRGKESAQRLFRRNINLSNPTFNRARQEGRTLPNTKILENPKPKPRNGDYRTLS